MVANHGSEVEGDQYICKTCIEGGVDLEDDESLKKQFFLCQECKDTCHQGHNVMKSGYGKFRCSCQFVTKQCKFARTCAFKYSVEDPTLFAIFKCKTDGLSLSQPLCHFCATVCHKDHVVKEKGYSEGVCVCSKVFDFCQLNQDNH